MSKPSADLKITCCGATSLLAGKLSGNVSGARGCAGARESATRRANGRAGCCASEARYTKLSVVGTPTGLHSIPAPLLNCCGVSPEADTLQRCRWSTSLQFELNRTVF